MATEKESLVKVKLLRDTWEGEKRVSAGTVIEVPLHVALWGVHEAMFAPDGENPFKKG